MGIPRARGVHQRAVGGLMDGTGSRGGNRIAQHFTTFAFGMNVAQKGI